ncbi:MAG: DUF262 domain-containing protein [Bacteroidetes bacterium]|jgi:hypothetical protein|nr:DUF262 domain-containing protein [Bacteroidota bacterium]
MMSQEVNIEVEADVVKIDDLFKGRLPAMIVNSANLQLKIDRYQRPYVWDTKKIQQLIDDIQEHKTNVKEKVSYPKSYYVGSILLHEQLHDNSKGYYIIDGQQRLTTLLLMYKLCGLEVDHSFVDLRYYHDQSFQSIQRNHKYLIERRGLSEDSDFKKALQNLEITLIVTNSIDLAFTFFDSQNSRGVRLKPTDLLKSYHLREINRQVNDTGISYLERSSARRWEHLQTFDGILNKEHDFAYELFNKFIWRIRRWKGNDVEKEHRDVILEEFQDETFENDSLEIPLFPNRQNMLSRSIIERKKDGLQRSGDHIQISGKSSVLPFTLRQPIFKGHHYFLFAEKYAEILRELFDKDAEDETIQTFNDYHKKIINVNSYYLRELFDACAVTFYDKYGTDRLLEFAELLGLAHANLRLSQHYVFRNSALKYMREYNLLDIISNSFIPQQVIVSLKEHIRPNTDERITTHVNVLDEDNDQELDETGVNERCLAAFIRYYDGLDLSDFRLGENLNLTWFCGKVIQLIETE